MADSDYHLRELVIARSLDDPRRVVPEIPRNCRRVLDIGCGAGQTLMTTDLGGALAFGIDLEFSALQLGQQIGAEAEFACAKGEALPFAKESFDFVFSRVALPYMDASKAVREMSRVLRPGGCIWMTLHPLSVLSWKRALSHPKRLVFEVYRLLNTALLHCAGRQCLYPLRRDYIESYQTERGMRLVLARAGFTDIQFRRSQHFLCMAKKP